MQPQPQTSSPDAGLLGPRIVCHQKKLDALFAKLGAIPALPSDPHATAPAGATSRLVKESQFPTRKPGVGAGTDEPGAYAVLSYREWDDTYRLRPVIEPRRRVVPSPQAGPRITDTLTKNGKRGIDDSARYLARIGQGYRTMFTLTLDTAARARTAPQVVAGDFCVLSSRLAVDGDWSTLEAVTHHDRYTPTTTATAHRVGVFAVGDYCDLATRRTIQPAAGPALFEEVVTVTLPEAEGVNVLAPVATMQQEASRFFDAVTKVYRRGMTYTNDAGRSVIIPGHALRFEPLAEVLPLRRPAGTKISGWRAVTVQSLRHVTPDPHIPEVIARPRIPRELKAQAEPGAPFTLIGPLEVDALRYCWVAEMPKCIEVDEETGEVLDSHDNPHIHVIIDWEVAHEDFKAWAARLESIWGHGFAHIERLRNPEAAGAYVLKAAKYVGKGADGEQGSIIGNRYFISAAARAPVFQGLAILPHGQLADLIAHAADHQRETLAPIRRCRDAARAAIKRATKDGKAKLTGKLKAWGKLLDGREIIAGTYQVLLRGAHALGRFFSWAAERGDTHADGPLLPSKPAGAVWSLDWTRNPDTTYHAGPTGDVLDYRDSRRLTRAWLKMPVWSDADHAELMTFYDRWEPANDDSAYLCA